MKNTDIIFIAGNSRSGTTMLGRILCLHDDIFTFNELHFFEQLWTVGDQQKKLTSKQAIRLYAQLLKNQRAGYISNTKVTNFYKDATEAISANDTTYSRHELFTQFVKNETKQNGKSVPCEQTPRNILYVKEILDLFQNAKIIVMVRDPRDVLLSQKGKWKRRFLGEKVFPLGEMIRSWANYHPITISKIWKMNASIIQRFIRHPSVMLVKFEDLIENPAQKTEEICQFLDIAFDPKMLAVPHIGSSNSRDKESKGISKDVAGNWIKGGLTKSEIYFCQRICSHGMAAFGYKTHFVKNDPIRIIVDTILFPFKLTLAFGLNLNRMKNIGESLSRRLGQT